MGVKEQQVQLYEPNQYSSAGFHRIAAVAKALNITIQVMLIFNKEYQNWTDKW